MGDWKADVLRMRFDEGRTMGYIIEQMQGLFPGKNASQIRDIIRGPIRNDPRYKTQKQPGESYKATTGWKDGVFESDDLIRMCQEDAKSPRRMLQLHGLNPDAWEVVSCRNNLWHSQVHGTGDRLLLYQSRLTAKPKADGISFAEIDRHFAQLDRRFVRPTIIVPQPDAHQMAEVNIADLHLGKLCWHGDTGNNYDSKIARDLFYQIIGEIIEDIKAKPLEFITFVWTNDFFNSDTIDKTTTGGTPQDTDVRWQKMFNIGVEMLVTAIDLLSQLAPVRTFYTKSNHDEVNAYHAIQYLSAWFRRDPNVEINIDAKPRKYMLYGANLLGFGHGDKENDKGTKDKASRLASLMPVEAPELWGKSKYREFHAAHLHSEQMIQEINGVAVRRISAPPAADTYHTDYGYLGAVRKAQTFIWDRERGLKQIINTPVA